MTEKPTILPTADGQTLRRALRRQRHEVTVLRSQERVLRYYVAQGTITQALKLAHVTWHTFQAWRKTDAEFKAQFEVAKQAIGDALEHVALTHARDGVLEPVYQGGVMVGKIRRFDHTLLLRALARFKPEYAPAKQAEVQVHTQQVIRIRWEGIAPTAPAKPLGEGQVIDGEVAK